MYLGSALRATAYRIRLAALPLPREAPIRLAIDVLCYYRGVA